VSFFEKATANAGGRTETYTVAVHLAEEGGYWGEVLELPGCASQGESIDELLENVIDAI
jgi:predicted RNase H-like HicB family nuclease